jgi:OmpA-OmpF porin, OOP family
MKHLTHSTSLGLVVLAAIASPLAQAQDSDPGAGWYGGASVGRTSANIDNARITSGLAGQGLATQSITNNDRDTGYKLFGGYQINPYLAVEAGWFDLGNFGYMARTSPAGTLNGDVRIRGLNLDVVGILPLTPKFSVFGRLGVANARSQGTFSATGAARVPYANANPSERSNGYKAGLGMAYAFTDSLSMRLEGERYRVNDSVGNKGHVDMVSIGLVYRFGAKSPTPAPAPVAVMPMPVAVAPPPPPPAPVAPPAPAPTPAPVVVAAPPVVAPPIKVTFSADSLFDFDKATVKPAAQPALDKFVSDLRGVNYDTVRVTGHTDRIGSHDYNMGLSERRAQAVSAWLVTSGGVPAGKISAQGVNSSVPVTRPEDCKGSKATARLIACLQPDRRVEVEVTGSRP